MADFSAKKGLSPNPKKTKIMVWKNTKTLRDKDLLWAMNGVEINMVKEHVDLGLLVSQKQTGRYNWSASCHLPLIKAATIKLHSIMKRAKDIGLQSPRLLCRLFDTLMRPSLTYGSKNWGVELQLLDHDKADSIFSRESPPSVPIRDTWSEEKYHQHPCEGGIWPTPCGNEHMDPHH